MAGFQQIVGLATVGQGYIIVIICVTRRSVVALHSPGLGCRVVAVNIASTVQGKKRAPIRSQVEKLEHPDAICLLTRCEEKMWLSWLVQAQGKDTSAIEEIGGASQYL